LGLPFSQVQNMKLAESPATSTASVTDIQTAALLNRLDIRIALERYAVAESKLKLEIAKQYPDITISPGYAYEFGDKIWSLGISGLLSMLNKNKGAIAEATQFREVEAAQFEALQAKVINDASVANEQYLQAQAYVQSQLAIRDQQLSNAARVQRRFTAGDADRLELVLSKLENLVAEKTLVLAQAQQAMALTALEDTLQESLLQSNKNPDFENSGLAESSRVESGIKIKE
jgi:outer membrane protein TolC